MALIWSAILAERFFVDRLRELGWIEGRTISIEYRKSEGRPERVARLRQSSCSKRSMSLSRMEEPSSH